MWVKLDDNISDHPKFFDAGRHLGRHGIARAFAVYVAGIAYANKHLTDGFLSESVVKSFKIDRNPCEIGEVLAFTDVGLWEPVVGGWRIHDFHHHNPKAQDIKDKRAADRDRKRRERAADEGSRPNGLLSESSALARARSDPDPDPSKKDHRTLRARACGKAVENVRVLRALVWREVAELYAAGRPAPHPGDVLEHLKCTAARAGLIYAVDDFKDQAERAIVRFSAGEPRRASGASRC